MHLTMQSKMTGDGSPLVLVPGGLTGWVSWDSCVPELSKKHKVIQVQLLNVDYGLRGEPLPDNYSLETESQALADTLHQHDIEKADIVAWSYGAATTLDFILNHPEIVRTVTLIEPPAIWILRSRGLLSQELQEQEKLIETFNVPKISEEQLVWFTHFAGFVPEDVDPKSLPQWPIWSKFRQSLKNNPAVFRYTNSIERIRHFNKPVLLITGEGTATFLADIIQVLAEELPNVRVERYPGGHAPHIVAKDQFLTRLNTFLETQN
jgi:pimeloyl-ACP methyl ester carboxylesterase